MRAPLTAPAPYCEWPRCGARVPRGRYCREHAREFERARGSRYARGYSAEWRAYSRRRLLAHPWCVRCEGRGFRTPGAHTDHVVPIRVAPDRQWDPSNHQTLCRKCHAEKTLEDLGYPPRST